MTSASTRRVLLVNASHPSYNLGLEKAARWWRRHGATVERSAEVPTLLLEDRPTVWLSAVFSWHVPGLIRGARAALDAGCEVEVGGPGTLGVRAVIQAATGLMAQATPDARFEREPAEVGAYRMVFWSRGCPAYNCSLGYPKDGSAPICAVPAMEGRRYTFHPDAIPAPGIMDNNLSALPRAYQEHVVERTLSAGFPVVDCQSAFEPRSFRVDTIARWRRLPLVAWRYAYDELAEGRDVHRVLALLADAGIRPRRSRIYCLAGNEPVAACEARVRDIVAWGALPIVQRRRPLDWLGGPLPVLHDWTEQRLLDFQRWGNRLARQVPRFADYVPNLRRPVEAEVLL